MSVGLVGPAVPIGLAAKIRERSAELIRPVAGNLRYSTRARVAPARVPTEI